MSDPHTAATDSAATDSAATDSAATVAAAAEMVEVIGPDGAVERIATRSEVRRANLAHRAVFIVVRFGSLVVVHKRSAWKDLWPNHWDLAFGGVLGVGEDWAHAARRELAEEAGVTVDESALRHLGGGEYQDVDVKVIGQVYEVTPDGPFNFADGEVVACEWVEADDLIEWSRSRPVVADSVAIVLPLLDLRSRC